MRENPHQLAVINILLCFVIAIFLFSSNVHGILDFSENNGYYRDQIRKQSLIKEKDFNLGKENNPFGNIFGFYILEFSGPIEQRWQEFIVHSGVELIGYLGEFKYLVRLENTIADELLNYPFIKNISIYTQNYKYDRNRFEVYLKNSQPTLLDLVVQFYPGVDGSKMLDELINNILELGGEILDSSKDRMLIRILSDHLNELVGLDNVLWVEPEPNFRYFNDVSAGIINADRIWTDLSLDGTGQIVTVCDTGLDNGSYSNLHEDFRGRLLRAYPMGRTGDWSDDDISFMGMPVGGHGTHVAGSVLGGGNHSAGKIKGMAYNATLVFQSTMDQDGNMNIPMDLYWNLFYPPYNNEKSKIHTNSWGDPMEAGEYSSYSNSTDGFIWDHKDQVILFAGGNIFMSFTKVSPPGTSKNVITVGASESYRASPIFSGHENDCNNIDQIASFSCYGTDDNRLKPDILCPGTGILSTRSSMIPDPDNHYWKNYDAYYAYAGGTSMATPITAGAVALIRQYFNDIENIPRPSAALIKAALINGAEDMPSTGGSQPIPNYREGWGRINLSKSINPEPPGVFMFIENKTGLTSLKNITYTIEVLNNSVPLNITLVWTDYPAAPSASYTLVNDLHLNLTHVDSGVSYKGNVFTNGWSTQDDSFANQEWDRYSTGYDNVNNVECFRIKNPLPGRYILKIVGSNIPFGPQPFVVALSGGLEVKVLEPRNIKVESVATGNALNITWDRVFGQAIKGYEIYRSISPDSGFVLINTTSGPNVAKYTDTNLIDGTVYYYKLRTVNVLGTFSTFSVIVSGTPNDIAAPWITIFKPLSGDALNKDIEIIYENDTDCNKVIFKYYNDTNKNDIPDDNNSWVILGIDTDLIGIYIWNTTNTGSGPGNQGSVILSIETFDEVPNSRTFYVRDLIVDNLPPKAPVLEKFTQHPINYFNIELSGTSEFDSTVLIYSNAIFLNKSKVDQDLKFNIEITLFEGLNYITARAIDSLGNGPGPASAGMEIMVDIDPPIADAGGNYLIDEDTWFTFNGSKSYDTNTIEKYNKIITYHWQFKKPNGTNVELEGKETKYFFETMGNYSIKFQVQDMAGNWDEHEFWVMVKDKTPPVAYAGENFTWDEDSVFYLSANRSTDNDPEFFNTANFTWVLFDYNEKNIEKGKIKEIRLYGINVSYKFSVPDKYKITLNITDAAGNWDSDIIVVDIRDITPPTADAGTDLMIELGRTVYFDATDSYDNDPTLFKTGNFSWSFNYIGNNIILYGAEQEFRFRKVNVFNVFLTVKDKWGNQDSDDLIVRVNSDIYLPTVEWTHPADNSWNVPVSTVIKIKLNETLDILKTPINLSNFQLFDSKYSQIKGEIRYDPVESLIFFIPEEILNFGQSYSVFLSSSLVDLAGNVLDGNGNGLVDPELEDMFKFIFSTINMSKKPNDNEKNVDLQTAITVQFSGNISKYTLNSCNLTFVNKKTNAKVMGSFLVNDSTYTIKFQPNQKLSLNTDYQVILSLKFYLHPDSNLSWHSLSREIKILPDDLNNSQINIIKVNYTWTFKTKKSEDKKEDSMFGLDLFSFILLMVCIIIVIILIIFFTILHRRRKVGEDEDLDMVTKHPEHELYTRRQKYIEDEGYQPYPDYEDEYGYDYYDDNESVEFYEDFEVRRRKKRAGKGKKKGKRRTPKRTQRIYKGKVRKPEAEFEIETEDSDQFEIEILDEGDLEETELEKEIDSDELDGFELAWDDEEEYDTEDEQKELDDELVELKDMDLEDLEDEEFEELKDEDDEDIEAIEDVDELEWEE